MITICILGLKAVDQGQGAEVLVSCVFWYVLQHYRVMPETWERCNKSIMVKIRRVNSWYVGSTTLWSRDRQMGHLEMKAIAALWAWSPIVRATITCATLEQGYDMMLWLLFHGHRWLLQQRHFRDPEEKGSRVVDGSGLLRRELENICKSLFWGLLGTLGRNLRNLGQEALKYYLLFCAPFSSAPPRSHPDWCDVG